MSSLIFKIADLLEASGIYFTIERTRSETIRFNVTLVGERLELDIFEDDHVEISRFRGSEDIEGGFPLFKSILDDYTKRPSYKFEVFERWIPQQLQSTKCWKCSTRLWGLPAGESAWSEIICFSTSVTRSYA